MKNKIAVLLLLSFLLVGCGKKSIEENLVCDIGNTVITVTVQDGKITKYVDKVRGDASSDEIAVLNDSYLKDITNNKDALSKLREVIAENSGDCK